MKVLRLVLYFSVLLQAVVARTQTVNWEQAGQKHILSSHIAADHALTFGLGYSYHTEAKRPVLLNAEYSFPSGMHLTDDFKIKTGAQVRWWQWGHFHIASKLQAIFRRYQNEYVRLLNVGADISATAGYYKRHWFIAGELGFDKAIVTHFKHSDQYKSNFPAVKDGWYEPSTGGTIYYGIQGGWSFGNKDLYLKLGKLNQQDLRSSPMLPVYAQLGFNVRIGRK
jgi:hypothetical protein